MKTRKRQLGFALLELEVSVVLLSMGVVTLSSLLMRQTRVLARVQGIYKPDATLYLTPSPDPWVQQMNVPARVTSAPLTLTAPGPVENSVNTLTLLNVQMGLRDESITVTVKVN